MQRPKERSMYKMTVLHSVILRPLPMCKRPILVPLVECFKDGMVG